MSIKVRLLSVEDVFTVTRMLTKVGKSARAELAVALKAKQEAEPMPPEEFTKLSPKKQEEEIKRQAEKKPDITELGISLFQSMFVETEEDLKAWLASLIGVETDDFKAMPATTLVDIVDGLMAQEGIMDFFERVSQLVTKSESKL